MKRLALLALMPLSLFADQEIDYFDSSKPLIQQKEYAHVLSPAFQYMEYCNELYRGSATTLGVEYKYLQPMGYNLKLTALTGSGGRFRPSTFLEIRNTYRTEPQKGFICYPIVSLNYGTSIYYDKKTKRDAGIEKAEIIGGVGLQKSFLDIFSVSGELEFFQEISKFKINRQRQDSVYWGWKGTKNNGFKLSFPLAVEISKNKSFELTPFYSDTFDEGCYTKGVKASFSFQL